MLHLTHCISGQPEVGRLIENWGGGILSCDFCIEQTEWRGTETDCTYRPNSWTGIHDPILDFRLASQSGQLHAINWSVTNIQFDGLPDLLPTRRHQKGIPFFDLSAWSGKLNLFEDHELRVSWTSAGDLLICFTDGIPKVVLEVEVGDTLSLLFDSCDCLAGTLFRSLSKVDKLVIEQISWPAMIL